MTENVAHLQALSEVREAKARTVFAAVLAHGPVSVTDLVALTSLSRPTVVSQLKELRRRGFLGEASEAEGMGRPATTYHVADDCFVLGLDLLDESMALALATLDGAVVHFATAKVPRLGRPDGRFRAAADAVTRLLDAHGLTCDQVVGAGVCHTGTIDRQGVITRATLVPMWTGFPLLERWEAVLGCPVVVANDLKAAAYGEFVARDDPPASLLYVKSDPGINVALVSGSQPFTGANGNAGEIADLTHADELEDDLWLDRVSYSLALACAVTDPGLVVLHAPDGTRDALSRRLTERWEEAKLSAHPPRVERELLGPAGAVVGALTLGTQHALTVALGGDGAPSPVVRGVAALREGLVEAGHALTIPPRDRAGRGADEVAVLGEAGEWSQALVAEAARHGVVLTREATPGSAGVLLLDALPGRTDRALELLGQGRKLFLPWPMAEDLDRGRELLRVAQRGDGRIFACPAEMGRARLQPLAEELEAGAAGRPHSVWIDLVDPADEPDPARCVALVVEAFATLGWSATSVASRRFGRLTEVQVLTDGEATLTLRHAPGAAAATTVTVVGETGRLVQEGEGPRARLWCQGREGLLERTRPEVTETFDPARALVGDFLDLLRHGQQIDGDPHRAWQGMALAGAVAQALAEPGGSVRVEALD